MKHIMLQGLTKDYGSLLAVDHVSLNIGEGEFFGLLGPNGAGKTTTIRMLVGLTTPSEGATMVNDYNIREESVKVKGCIGVVSATSNLYDELTVWDNMVFMAGMYHVPRKERETRIQSLLKTFALSARAFHSNLGWASDSSMGSKSQNP